MGKVIPVRLMRLFVFTVAASTAFVVLTKQSSVSQGSLHNTRSQEQIILHADPAPLCLDTCPTANNGKCEDGRGVLGSRIICDLGTDCTDCGEWKRDDAQWNPGHNIKTLTDLGIEIYAQRTVTEPSFVMPYTRPEFDVDVSKQMAFSRGVELGETHLWYHALKSCCTKPDGSRGLVLDVGGNFGWYALFSARMGCRVITWEPVPHFRDFLLYGVAVNNLTSTVEVRGRVVGSESGKLFEMVVPQRGIWGTASIDAKNIDKGIDNDGDFETVEVLGERIDDVVSEDVCVFKADVEGFEPDVFASAERLFEDHRVENVFMEYSPGVWERTQNGSELGRTPHMLLNLVQQGYNARHIPDRYSKSFIHGKDFNKPPPLLEVVTEENLKHDIQDAFDFGNGNLGCSKIMQEQKDILKGMGLCNQIPESLHPMSFHSVFNHNTNVWLLRKDIDELPQGPAVGVIKPWEDETKFFKTAEYGQGGRVCKDIEPEFLTYHRCPCGGEAVCHETESKILDALKRMQQNDNA